MGHACGEKDAQLAEATRDALAAKEAAAAAQAALQEKTEECDDKTTQLAKVRKATARARAPSPATTAMAARTSGLSGVA